MISTKSNTPTAEAIELRKQAKRISKKYKERKPKEDEIHVKIHNGIMIVPKSKYLKKRDYYDGLNVRKW